MKKVNQVNQSDLAVVFRNPKPRREGEYPSTWLLLAGGQALKVLVIRDAETRPHVILHGSCLVAVKGNSHERPSLKSGVATF
jgi:hypothetical protein